MTTTATPFPTQLGPTYNYTVQPRDSQRSRLYRAEQTQRTQTQVQDPQAFITALLRQHPTLSTLHLPTTYGGSRLTAHVPIPTPRPTFNVNRQNKRTSSANWQTGVIRLAAGWGQNPLVILHEYAHLLHRQRFGIASQAHGREFAGTFLHLVEAAIATPQIANTTSPSTGLPIISPNAAASLAAAFHAHGVRFTRFASPAGYTAPTPLPSQYKVTRLHPVTGHPFPGSAPVIHFNREQLAATEQNLFTAFQNELLRVAAQPAPLPAPAPVQPEPQPAPAAPYGINPANGQPYKRRPMTPERRAQVAEQLRAARAAQKAKRENRS